MAESMIFRLSQKLNSPDFMLCEMDSGGYHWILIELESPTHRSMTKAGEQSAKLTHALRQIRDWRIWLRKNIQWENAHSTRLPCPHLRKERP